MAILISNDDGIHAPGLKALAESLQDLDQILVVAPDRERSATGHGITVHRPLRIEAVSLPGVTAQAWAINGTPADCVKLAVDNLLPNPPSLVVAGINQGPNLGTDVLYSGTVSAAIEGIINGFPALAFSLTSYDRCDFSTAAQVARRIVSLVLQEGLPQGTLLNINVPAAKPRGIRITRLGYRRYVNVFHKRTDPRGRIYYWMAGEPLDLEESSDNTDVQAIRDNCISITPIQLDLTDYKAMAALRHWSEEKQEG